MRKPTACQMVIGFAAAILAAALPATAAAQSYYAVVQTISGTTVEGALLEISAGGVHLDPDGPVSRRVLQASEIRSVYVTELDRSFSFPLDEAGLPVELQRRRANVRKPVSFGLMSLAVTIGRMTVESGDDDYYSGFGGGNTLRTNFRYFFPDSDPRARRVFLCASVYQSTPKPNLEEFGIGPSSPSVDLRIREYGLGVGMTTRMSKRGSFAHLLGGLALLKNRVGVVEQDIRVSVTDSQLGFRFELGGTYGLTPNWGLEAGTGFDLVYAGQADDETTFVSHDRRAVWAGWILHLSVGAVYHW